MTAIGAETEFIWFDFAGQGHGQYGATVKAVFKCDNGRFPALAAGDFDSILYGLGSAVGGHNRFVKIARGL
jgi:hypothetical protein